jgi:hypothetical protein
MRTTVEIPDNLYRQIKARAALDGQTIKAFFLEAVRDKLVTGKDQASESGEESGFWSVFGKGDKEEIAEVQRIIDEEFSKIDYADWGLPAPDEPT